MKDYEKKWYHLRTKIGTMLSLDEYNKNDLDFTATCDFDDLILQKQIAELEKAFINSLNDSDRRKILLRQKKYTQKEIAQELGYKNHSGVTKRLKAIRKMLDEFIKQNLK